MVEVVTEYMSKDGNKYDTYEKAMNADNDYDLKLMNFKKELDHTKKYGEKRFSKYEKSTYPAIIIAHSHFNETYYLVNEPNDVLKAYKHIFITRYVEGYYTFSTATEEALSKAVFDKNDLYTIFGFLYDRTTGEDEMIEFERPYLASDLE